MIETIKRGQRVKTDEPLYSVKRSYSHESEGVTRYGDSIDMCGQCLSNDSQQDLKDLYEKQKTFYQFQNKLRELLGLDNNQSILTAVQNLLDSVILLPNVSCSHRMWTIVSRLLRRLLRRL